MLKQTTLATIVVFIVWSLLDFVIHNILLQQTYQETAHLWRALEDMKMPVMTLVTLLFAAGFVSIYSYFVAPKSLTTGIKYGIVFGLTMGIMSFSSYGYMPIPLSLAISWFVGSLVEIILAGIIVGVMVKDD